MMGLAVVLLWSPGHSENNSRSLTNKNESVNYYSQKEILKSQLSDDFALSNIECDTLTVPYSYEFDTDLDCAPIMTPSGNPWSRTMSNYPLYGIDGPHASHESTYNYQSNSWLITNPIFLLKDQDYELFYKFANVSSEEDGVKMKVAIGDSPDYIGMDVVLVDQPNIYPQMINQKVVYFTVPEDGVYYLGFNAYSDAGTAKLLLTEIELDVAPDCFEPGDIIFRGRTETSIDVEWTENGNATEWEVIYGPEGFDIATEGTIITVTGTPEVQVTGLQHTTHYEFYVRSICGSSEKSEWSWPGSIPTECGVFDVPYAYSFDRPGWCAPWETISGNDWVIVRSGYHWLGFPDEVFVNRAHPETPADAWTYTNPINLEEGVDYEISYRYGNSESEDIVKMKVAFGVEGNHEDMTNVLADYPSIVGSQADDDVVYFTVPADGVYYFGFQAYSDSGNGNLILSHIKVDFKRVLEPYTYHNGTWTPEHPNLSATADDSIVVISGTADGSDAIYDLLDIGDIQIDEGATLEVESVLNVHGDLIINGDLIFKSGADYDGELGIMAGNITGEATVHRYMSHNRAYRMVSSAVTTTTSINENWQEGVNNPDTNTNHNPAPGYGTHITGSKTGDFGFDATQTGNPSMYWVDVQAQQFIPIDNTNQYTLDAGDAYLLFVRGDRGIDLNDPTNSAAGETILRTKGTLFQGEQSKVFEGVDSGNFIMFGNPYQSALDVELVLNTADNANTNHYYVYDPTLGTHGSYVTVSLTAGVSNTSGSEANQYLQPGQAAQYATISSGASYLIIREEHKAPGQHTHTNFNGNDNMLTVQLYTGENFNNGGPVHDSFGMIFDDSFDNEITHEDAVMPFNFYENLGIDNNGTYLSLERRRMPEAGEVHQLYINGYSETAYALKLMVDGLENSAIYLEDHYTGEITLLEDGEIAYNFTVDQGEPLSMATDRFTIRTENVLGVPNNDLFANVSLYPNPMSDNTFYINAPQLDGKNVNVAIADLGGRTVYKETLNFNSNQITVSTTKSLASGVYLVTMEHDGAMHTFKLVKK